MAIDISYNYLNLLLWDRFHCPLLLDALLPPSSHSEHCQFAVSFTVSAV